MKPIKLTMTAFGSYVNKTEIDFTKLGDEGLYLITGDTGAGKTTIFDAITYALYGAPSGTYRDAKMMRSRNVPDDATTEVELVFETNGKRYTVTRSFKFQWESKDGKGPKIKGEKSVLQFPDDKKPLAGKTEIKAEIEKLLGVTQPQFKQIIMLAQGEFRKMLFAKESNERSERKALLRKVLGTELYEKFQDVLKAKAGACEKADKETKADAILKIKSADCEGLAELEEAKDKIVGSGLEDISALEDFAKQLGEQCRIDREQQSMLGGEIEKARKSSSELSTKIGEARDKNNRYETRERQKEALPGFEKNAEETKREFERVQAENRPKIDELSKQIILINNSLSKYERLDNILVELNSSNKTIETGSGQLTQFTEFCGKAENELKELKNELSLLKNAGENIAALDKEFKDLESEQHNICDFIEDLKNYDKSCDRFKLDQQDFLEANECASRLFKRFEELRYRYYNERAGLCAEIAEALEDGEPCPVCGSTNHPNKAERSESSPGPDDVNDAEIQADTARKKADELSNYCAKIKGSLEMSKEALRQQLSALGFACELSEAYDKAEERQQELKNIAAPIRDKLEEEQKRKARHDELETVIPEKEEKLNDTKERCKSLEMQISSAKVRSEELQKQYNELKADLRFAGKQAAEDELSALDSQSDSLKEAIEAARQTADKSKQKLSELRALIEGCDLPEDYVPVDIDVLNEKLSELEGREKGFSESAKKIEFRLKSNSKALDEIKEITPQLIESQKQLDLLQNLSDAANGNLNQKRKQSLESFVQAELFNEILWCANVRFRQMTDGQFALLSDESSAIDKDHTLNIQIIDTDSKIGDVGSLSGGEAFLASLSLALGLSEVVQQKAGGVELETMFVDEGFGSLDEKTMQEAMTALNNLAEKGLLIGIISHVDELKRSIPKQIIVKKDSLNGSTAEIRV